MIHTIKLIKKMDIADGTMAFHFEKPAGFEYVAGQYADFTLVNPQETDVEGNKRSFSLSSAPHEEDIIIATRMRDTAFKRVLKSLSLGTEIQISDPMGSFTLHNNAEKPAVFLAGGIGITPFFSMIKNAAHHKLPQKITLFYSNKYPESAAFLDELFALEKENSSFTFVPTMTEMPARQTFPSENLGGEKSQQPWSGETRFINAEMLNKYLKDNEKSEAIFYTAGPPAMVAAMRNMLEETQVNPDNIRTEEFSGY